MSTNLFGPTLQKYVKKSTVHCNTLQRQMKIHTKSLARFRLFAPSMSNKTLLLSLTLSSSLITLKISFEKIFLLDRVGNFTCEFSSWVNDSGLSSAVSSMQSRVVSC